MLRALQATVVGFAAAQVPGERAQLRTRGALCVGHVRVLAPAPPLLLRVLPRLEVVEEEPVQDLYRCKIQPQGMAQRYSSDKVPAQNRALGERLQAGYGMLAESRQSHWTLP
jgi:hypothetical protein